MLKHCVTSFFVVLLTFHTAAFTSGAEDAPAALQNYMKRPEPDFSWEVTNRVQTENGRRLEMRLTSQKWHDIVWQHAVEIFEPAKVEYPGHALLFVTGGSQPPRSPSQSTLEMGAFLAKRSGARVVVLHQVPNQPLFDNRREDDLITETWLKYLQTGDETWPLLFPMVKSAVKTMDAVQQLSADEFGQKIDKFVITGASKRGWTSWLTPVADSRVVATAPVVIDVLNFRAQMDHQMQTWGKFSDQIIDYSSKGLIVTGDESPREKNLRLMMDPYTYRKQLALPKLLVNGTNDPYWVCDAMKWYWPELAGPKYAVQVPNAGHGLDGGRELALSTVAAFTRCIASGRPLPSLNWKVAQTGTQVGLNLTSNVTPVAARLWSAHSNDLDFRDERWSASELSRQKNRYIGTVEKNGKPHVALYGELQFAIDDVPYSLCTIIHRD